MACAAAYAARFISIGDDMDRRGFLKTVVAAAVPVVVTGCITRAYGVDGQMRAGYTEVIDSVLMSGDGANVVVVGKAYDYVFAEATRLSELIRSRIHPHLSASFGDFAVKPGNAVSGTLVLQLTSDDAEVAAAAEPFGFRRTSPGAMQVRLPLQGTRYGKRADVTVGQSYRLNRAYSVQVALPGRVDVGAVLLSPLKVVGAGVLVLVAIPLIAMSIISGEDMK